MARRWFTHSHRVGQAAHLQVLRPVQAFTVDGHRLADLREERIGPAVYVRLSRLWQRGPVQLHVGQSLAPLARQRHYDRDADVVIFLGTSCGDMAYDLAELHSLEFWLRAAAQATAHARPQGLRCQNGADHDGGLGPDEAAALRSPVLAVLSELALLRVHPTLRELLVHAGELMDVTAGTLAGRLPAAARGGSCRSTQEDLALIIASGLLPPGAQLEATTRNGLVNLVLTASGQILEPATGRRFGTPSSVLTSLIRDSGTTAATRRNGWDAIRVCDDVSVFHGRTLGWLRRLAEAMDETPAAGDATRLSRAASATKNPLPDRSHAPAA